MKSSEAAERHPFLQRPWVRGLIVVAGFVALNLLLIVAAPGRGIWRDLPSLAVEVTAVFLGLALLAEWRFRLTRLVRFTAVGLLLGLWLFHAAERTVISGFSRPLNLYTDVPLLPELLRLMRDTVPAGELVAYGVGGTAGLAALAAAITWLLRFAATTFEATIPRRTAYGVAALATGLHLVGVPAFAPSVTNRIVEEVDFMLHVAGYRDAKNREINEVAARSDHAAIDLGDADFSLIFVESYGHTVLDVPDHRALVVPAWERFESTMRSAGYDVVSRWADSPVFGGASWLAHASLLTGVRVEDQMEYNLLLRSSARPLAEVFGAAGYRTVSAMPGVKRDWPEGAYFAFDEHYFAKHFDYEGPSFGWAPMPDQFVLEVIRRRELSSPDRPPLFAEFVLISSHSPFTPQPPMVPWDSLDQTGRVYESLEPLRYPIEWPALEHAETAYARSISYDFEVIEGFLLRAARNPRGHVVMILGDHQPPAQIAGEDKPAWVPAHLLSDRPELLEPFRRASWSSGMSPVETEPIPMEALFFAITNAYASESQ